MAIADILWACPACREFGSLQSARRGAERCEVCGASFRRGRGAAIDAEIPGGRRISRTASEWMDDLPLEFPRREDGAVAAARATIRQVEGYQPVRRGAELLNRIELLGPSSDVVITLYDDRIRIGPERSSTREWPLDQIAAVGSSSGTLQLRIRHTGLIAIRLHDASLRWWEEQLRLQLRNAYARAGRGNIVEFQPQIIAI